MIYIGIDPSYRRTGISVYNSTTNKLELFHFPPHSDKVKSFENVWATAHSLSTDIVEKVKSYGDDIKVISECPPPSGNYASGLWGLDSLIFSKLSQFVKSIHVVYPNYLGHIHETRDYSKSDSVTVAKNLMIMLPIDSSSVPKRISHDEAESLIFLTRLLIKENVVDTTRVTNLYKNYLSTKEKLLFEVL